MQRLKNRDKTPPDGFPKVAFDPTEYSRLYRLKNGDALRMRNRIYSRSRTKIKAEYDRIYRLKNKDRIRQRRQARNVMGELRERRWQVERRSQNTLRSF